MKYIGRTDEYFELSNVDHNNCDRLHDTQKNQLLLLWFTSDNNKLTIDSIEHTFNTNQIVFLTEFHQVEINKIYGVKLLRFNKPFYCILDHDSEVGCKGILFFGAASLPILSPSESEIEVLETVWKMLIIEMESKDRLQLEMLQMMLKRILILCTRIYKNQENYQVTDNTKVDLIREFNFLVEKHFREKHTVAEYATLLNKSPKTISNLFKKASSKTPLRFIQERKMLEARRLLRHSDKGISEIGYEIGFNDIQAFSRFFKKYEGVSPSIFKSSSPEGKLPILRE